MATTQFDPPLPGSSFFDIYNDGAAQRNPVPLPGGACNYVDLTPGANGAKCGCRRFWSRFAVGRAYTDNLGTDNSVWCMCSHHACFHDDGRAASEAPAPAPTPAFTPTPVVQVAGQENERPRTSREPLSPVQLPDMSFRMPTGFTPTMEFMNLDAAMAISPNKPEEPRPCQPDHSTRRPESTLQDTLSWGDFIQSHPGNAALPPIPAQCLMQSQPSSTASSSQARYLRPFAGKGLQTLSGVAASNVRSPRKDIFQDADLPVQQDQQAKDDAGTMVLHSEHGADTPRAPQSPVAVGKVDAVFAGPSRDTFRHLSDTVQGHEHRLERLENVSFSAAGHDECHEKHDATDLRVTDLEVRVEEVEKLLNDNSSTTDRRADRQTFDESTNSVVSVATSTTTRAGHSGEIFSQIQSLQSQILQLQSLLPTNVRPWEIEVVFLPFPLKRIWQELQDFKSDGTSSLDEWTQMPNTMSSATLRAQSPFCAEWADPGHDYEWLMAKACSPMSIINKRLESRGLVRTISVKGSDARSVQAAMHAAFGTTFAELSGGSRSASRRRSLDSKTSRFLGLQQPWVPLRKIHKDSRLRFLTPAEMITPALWDVSFLNSVIMRSSKPRLFITQPEAYLQDLSAYESGWNWQRLREISRFYPDSQATVPEADAREDYWAWNDQLDETASAQPSLSIRQAGQRVSASPSLHQIAMQSSMRSSSPMVTRGQTPARERRPSKSPYIRTTSLPPAVPASFSPSQQIKRRVSSFGQQRAVAPIRTSPPNISTAYKRRRTRSPSRPINTPRWTVSPSPMPGLIPSDERHPSTRGITPHYYATPYSNAPLAETRPRGSGHVVDGSPTEDDENLDPDYGSTNPYDDGDESDYSVEMAAQPVPVREGDSSYSRQIQLPEDEPWPGIEDQDQDQDHMSDGENIDPLFSPTAEDDVHSEVSSQPSEYPSTQRGWQVPGADDGVGFRIHEDNERMHGWN
ncbi:hypothetical protein ColLi_02286 [Colletotrichum liriopes]|uniref:Uncharacterized protein n=1 Tax=Colletotrichum liriopes TaxID=708192 RepID=A0AA37GFK2_9PEZI|nr:hypothetical protein ColLi_02286 [Colletotrichum liriopes]